MLDRSLTIGLFHSQLDRGFHRQALASVARAAEVHGANLICFDGNVLNFPGDFATQGNVLYDLVSQEVVDGILVWASALDWAVDQKAMEAFCHRYRPLPIVSVGPPLEGIPSVEVDNYQGMHAAIVHLIRDHGYRRIAFLRGPEGNREELLRYQAYRDALEQNGIVFQPSLVSGHTNWERPDGLTSVRLLLDERGHRPGVDFEALVSVGDDMACGAIEALLARGIRVPDQVAVVGFNDDEEGRAFSPSLTTVRQPVEAMAFRAVEELLALIAGSSVTEHVILPLELMVRRSCGCQSPNVIRAAVGGRPSGKIVRGQTTPSSFTEEMRAAVLTELRLAVKNSDFILPAGWDQKILQAFLDELQIGNSTARPGSFLSTLNEVLNAVAANQGEASSWQAFISTMRAQISPLVTANGLLAPAEDLWQQARVLVAETVAQERAYQKFKAEQYILTLSEVSREIQIASSRSELMDKIAGQLPRLGITSFYLALYAYPAVSLDWVQLLLAYTDGVRMDLKAYLAPYRSRQLVAPVLLPQNRLFSLVAVPLYFRYTQLGFALLETQMQDMPIFETLREQISSALESVLLREEIEQAWKKAEEANQLKSRFLATVSHELRTPLSLIVGTIEMLIHGERTGKAPLPESYRQDMGCIHTSAQHLAHLIGDVLDLASSQAGELRIANEPVNLSKLLAEVSVLGETLAREKGLVWQFEIPDYPIWVRGDRTRLRQVALNLLSNAVKFTAQGRVTLCLLSAGRSVTVMVSDTGLGIPLSEQETIFDEFQRTERSVERGYGGMGLGLAITRRLVDLHGGKVGVSSTGDEGTGSTFYFTLPIIEAQESPPDLPGEREHMVLLLAENTSQAEILRKHLQKKGFTIAVLDIERNPDWLARVIAAPPGAVVLDYQPAAERGWELMQCLKNDPATHDIPVVFYSLAAEGGVGSMLEVDYLTKPLGQAELVQVLDRLGLSSGAASDVRRILVVDDEPCILDLHTRLLADNLPNCLIDQASDGRQAMRIMQREQPDLVLLDLMMPGMDGFDVLEAMRSSESTRSIPVIILTAQVLTGQDMARLQQGVAAVLGKNLFSESEVLAQVENALAHSRRLDSLPQRLVRQAMAYIHEHYTSPFSRADLARYLSVTDRYLTRCFHQEMGITPVTYLNRYRVMQAKKMLLAGRANFMEVAQAVGFSDSNYFGRVFREEVGVTPGAYLRGKRKPGA